MKKTPYIKPPAKGKRELIYEHAVLGRDEFGRVGLQTKMSAAMVTRPTGGIGVQLCVQLGDALLPIVPPAGDSAPEQPERPRPTERTIRRVK